MEESEEAQGSFSGGKKDFKLLLFFFPFIFSLYEGGEDEEDETLLDLGNQALSIINTVSPHSI